MNGSKSTACQQEKNQQRRRETLTQMSHPLKCPAHQWKSSSLCSHCKILSALHCSDLYIKVTLLFLLSVCLSLCLSGLKGTVTSLWEITESVSLVHCLHDVQVISVWSLDKGADTPSCACTINFPYKRVTVIYSSPAQPFDPLTIQTTVSSSSGCGTHLIRATDLGPSSNNLCQSLNFFFLRWQGWKYWDMYENVPLWWIFASS